MDDNHFCRCILSNAPNPLSHWINGRITNSVLCKVLINILQSNFSQSQALCGGNAQASINRHSFLSMAIKSFREDQKYSRLASPLCGCLPSENPSSQGNKAAFSPHHCSAGDHVSAHISASQSSNNTLAH